MKFYLVGFPAAGKSTYGKELASLLGYNFLDTDSEIERISGTSIKEIFTTKGEDAFRLLEKQVIESAANQDNLVIACGGGLPCYNNLMDFMNENGTTVFLKVHEEELLERISQNYEDRPFFEGVAVEELENYIHQLYRKRVIYYFKSQVFIYPEKLPASEFKKILEVNL